MQLNVIMNQLFFNLYYLPLCVAICFLYFLYNFKRAVFLLGVLIPFNIVTQWFLYQTLIWPPIMVFLYHTMLGLLIIDLYLDYALVIPHRLLFIILPIFTLLIRPATLIIKTRPDTPLFIYLIILISLIPFLIFHYLATYQSRTLGVAFPSSLRIGWIFLIMGLPFFQLLVGFLSIDWAFFYQLLAAYLGLTPLIAIRIVRDKLQRGRS